MRKARWATQSDARIAFNGFRSRSSTLERASRLESSLSSSTDVALTPKYNITRMTNLEETPKTLHGSSAREYKRVDEKPI